MDINGVILLMDKILHQLSLVIYPIILRALYIPGGAGFLPPTVWGEDINLAKWNNISPT